MTDTERARASALDRMLARDAIREILARYARAIDRADGPLLKSCYFDDAIEEHGSSFTGRAHDYVDAAIPKVRKMGVMQHLLGNSYIELTATARTSRHIYGLSCAWSATVVVGTRSRAAGCTTSSSAATANGKSRTVEPYSIGIATRRRTKAGASATWIRARRACGAEPKTRQILRTSDSRLSVGRSSASCDRGIRASVRSRLQPDSLPTIKLTVVVALPPMFNVANVCAPST